VRLERLENILAEFPKYRRAQVRRALYENLVESWSAATALPADLRSRLEREVPLSGPEEIARDPSGESWRRLAVLSDGAKVESVLIRHRDGRNTVCVSAQSGCALGCRFCATAALGEGRNLAPGELVEQVLALARPLRREGGRVGNVVFMGMGEPFLNYDAVLAAVRELVAPDGLDLAARRVSISTAGIVPGIMRLASEPLQVNLAVSLHAPDDRLRSDLMPINRRYPLGRLIPAVRDYIAATGRKVMIEYLLLDRVNDGPDQARALAELLRGGLGRLFFVNLIRANPARGYAPSSEGRRRRFQEILEKRGIPWGLRSRFGLGVSGSCGQLAAGKTGSEKTTATARRKDASVLPGPGRDGRPRTRKGPGRSDSRPGRR